MTARNKTRKLRGGGVVQAGLDLRDRSSRQSVISPKSPPYRAIVVESRKLDHTDNIRGVSVECDVILIRANIALQNVPVLQVQHGVNNAHALWVPRPTTRVIGEDNTPVNLSRQLSRRGSYNGPPTDFALVDGDMVLVDYIEGNQDFPVIAGCLPHQQTNRKVNSGTGWREGDPSTRGEMRENEFYVHHYGSEVRINEQGDLLLDTVGAYTNPATEDSSPATGQIRMRLKDGQKFTVECDGTDVLEVFKDGSGVHVHLGEGAIQSLIKGDAFKTLYDAHTHSSPAGGSTGPPAVPMDTPAGTHLSTQHKVT